MDARRSQGFMLHSSCPGCGANNIRTVWTLVDAGEQPDVVQQIRAGRLNLFTCESCGRTDRVSAPLLLLSPGRRRPLLFSPQPGGDTPSHVPKVILDAAREKLGAAEARGSTINEQSLNNSLDHLRKAMGAEWDEEWAALIRKVPRTALRATVAGELVFPDPQNELEEALGAYQQTASRGEARYVIEAFPVLLSDAALKWYDGQNGDAERRRLLTRCREVGVQQAFTELADRLSGEAAELSPSGDFPKKTALYREALTLVRRAEDGRRWALYELGQANSLIQDPAGGRQRRVEEAIRAYRQVLGELDGWKKEATWASVWAAAARCLASALVHDAPGDQTANLEDAIGLYRKVLRVYTRKQEPALWASTMRDLAIAWRVRREGAKIENLKRALQYCKKGLKALSEDGTPFEWRLLHDTLGTVYSELADAGKDRLVHLRKAMECFRRALNTAPAMREGRSAMLTNLGAVLEALGQFEDGVQAYRDALELAAAEEDRFGQSRILNNLAAAYKLRSPEPSAEDLGTAAEYYRQALDLVSMEDFPEDHRRMAGDLGGIYFRQSSWAEAAATYRQAVKAAGILYQGSVLTASKQSELAITRDLHHRAAYSIARSDDSATGAREAAVMLEHGRSRILGETLDRDRVEIARLEAHDRVALTIPTRSSEYRKAARNLELLESQERALGSGAPGEAALREDLRRERAKLHSVVEQIRHLPGFEGFLKQPGFDEICLSATPGVPLVYVVAAQAGSMAVLVSRRDTDAVAETVWAGSLTSGRVEGLLSVGDSEDMSERLTAKLDEILAVVGEGLIAPLAARLEAAGAEGVVFVPCGILGLIPLHACVYEQDGRAAVLIDRFDVSYAPSARFLAAAQESLRACGAQPAALAGIANPLPTERELRFALMELEQAASCFPESGRAVLYGSKARREALEESMKSASHAHFACHGRFEPSEPLDSSLDLADGDRLTLRQVLDGTRYRGLRLAVLSACETARIEHERLPDEFIGLPAGFLSAGAAGVVGTLWSVNDISTALLMGKFYEYFFAGDQPPRALRRAQIWLRTVTSGELFYFFDTHRKGEIAMARPKLFEAAPAGAAAFGLDDPNHQPYERSPYHWASFVFVGA
jgi:CHAT domain-containing protein/tetratricopeptide (TPR) repeat protein